MKRPRSFPLTCDDIEYIHTALTYYGQVTKRQLEQNPRFADVDPDEFFNLADYIIGLCAGMKPNDILLCYPVRSLDPDDPIPF